MVARFVFGVLLFSCGSRDKSEPPKPPEPPKPATVAPLPTVALPPEMFGSDQTFGTDDPVVKAEVDPKGRWVIVCQPRDHFGDPGSYLSFGGVGVAVSAFTAISSTGDHFVIHAYEDNGETRPLLIDATKRTALALPKRTRVAAFSTDGQILDYVADDQLVHRTLADGKSVAWPIGHATSIESRGRWVRIDDGGLIGRDNWCEYESRAERDRPEGTFRMTVSRWLDTTTGMIVQDSKLERPVGDHLLTRDTPTTLALDGKPIGPRNCKELDVIGVYEPLAGIVTGCTPDRGERRIEYVATGIASVWLPITAGWGDRPPATLEAKWCPSKCVDLATGKMLDEIAPSPLEPVAGDPIVGRVGDRFLAKTSRGVGPLRWRVANPPLAIAGCVRIANYDVYRWLPARPATPKVDESALAKLVASKLSDWQRCARSSIAGSSQVIVGIRDRRIVNVLAGGHEAGIDACLKTAFYDLQKIDIATKDGAVACNFTVGAGGPLRVAVPDSWGVFRLDDKTPPTSPPSDRDTVLIVRTPTTPKAHIDAAIALVPTAKVVMVASADPDGGDPIFESFARSTVQ